MRLILKHNISNASPPSFSPLAELFLNQSSCTKEHIDKHILEIRTHREPRDTELLTVFSTVEEFRGWVKVIENNPLINQIVFEKLNLIQGGCRINVTLRISDDTDNPSKKCLVWNHTLKSYESKDLFFLTMVLDFSENCVQANNEIHAHCHTFFPLGDPNTLPEKIYLNVEIKTRVCSDTLNYDALGKDLDKKPNYSTEVGRYKLFSYLQLPVNTNIRPVVHAPESQSYVKMVHQVQRENELKQLILLDPTVHQSNDALSYEQKDKYSCLSSEIDNICLYINSIDTTSTLEARIAQGQEYQKSLQKISNDVIHSFFPQLNEEQFVTFLKTLIGELESAIKEVDKEAPAKRKELTANKEVLVSILEPQASFLLKVNKDGRAALALFNKIVFGELQSIKHAEICLSTKYMCGLEDAKQQELLDIKHICQQYQGAIKSKISYCKKLIESQERLNTLDSNFSEKGLLNQMMSQSHQQLLKEAQSHLSYLEQSSEPELLEQLLKHTHDYNSIYCVTKSLDTYFDTIKAQTRSDFIRSVKKLLDELTVLASTPPHHHGLELLQSKELNDFFIFTVTEVDISDKIYQLTTATDEEFSHFLLQIKTLITAINEHIQKGTMDNNLYDTITSTLANMQQYEYLRRDYPFAFTAIEKSIHAVNCIEIIKLELMHRNKIESDFMLLLSNKSKAEGSPIEKSPNINQLFTSLFYNKATPMRDYIPFKKIQQMLLLRLCMNALEDNNADKLNELIELDPNILELQIDTEISLLSALKNNAAVFSQLSAKVINTFNLRTGQKSYSRSTQCINV
jgi:hypothetical protein